MLDVPVSDSLLAGILGFEEEEEEVVGAGMARGMDDTVRSCERGRGGLIVGVVESSEEGDWDIRSDEHSWEEP